MQILDFLTPERTFFAVELPSKKRALEFISQVFSEELNVAKDELFEAFIKRERLGSTVLEHGIALPHIRTPAVKHPLAALVKLAYAIDFAGNAYTPIDILFALVVPVEACDEHLQILAILAERFNKSDFRQQVEQATDAKTLYKLVSMS